MYEQNSIVAGARLIILLLAALGLYHVHCTESSRIFASLHKSAGLQASGQAASGGFRLQAREAMSLHRARISSLLYSKLIREVDLCLG